MENETTMDKIKSLVEDLSADMVKVEKGNKSAGTRVRKVAQELKSLLQTLRLEVLDKRK